MRPQPGPLEKALYWGAAIVGACLIVGAVIGMVRYPA